MSKIIHCDENNCSSAITADVEPSTWIHVERRARPTHEFSGWDFCSWKCMAAFARKD